jgi:hypothetical protein
MAEFEGLLLHLPAEEGRQVPRRSFVLYTLTAMSNYYRMLFCKHAKKITIIHVPCNKSPYIPTTAL